MTSYTIYTYFPGGGGGGGGGGGQLSCHRPSTLQHLIWLRVKYTQDPHVNFMRHNKAFVVALLGLEIMCCVVYMHTISCLLSFTWAGNYV